MPVRTLGFGAFLLSVVLLAMAVLGGAFAADGAGGAKVVVQDAKVRLAPIPGRPSAAYFTIQGGKGTDFLVAVSSPAAERVEMHETIQINGVMRMQPIEAVEVPARKAIAFRPGGRHLMIFGVKKTVTPGTTLPLILTFEKAGKVTVDAKVEAFGAAGGAPQGDHSGHHH